MEQKYNKDCVCNYCQSYRQLQPIQIPQSWIDGIKDQNSLKNQHQFIHISPLIDDK